MKDRHPSWRQLLRAGLRFGAEMAVLLRVVWPALLIVWPLPMQVQECTDPAAPAESVHLHCS